MSGPIETQTPSDQATLLEAEDRIEVTAFIERKTWIQEKIKLLEALPPIDVFYGVDHITPANTGVPVEGLPTRQEVAFWITEHDQIESETEKFDKGDMIRLKKFAKAKSEQNLSPEDTDLIELTLETLFALDKLMHLLRQRRDSLEQTDLRLRWEELRVGAWEDRKLILSDIDAFVKQRAHWTPEVYEALADPPQSDTASATSIPKMARSPTSTFLAIARSSRYKYAETLSKEAAAYASRVLGFHNSWITPSGMSLDKLIERRTVPEPILDEQDRLEDQTKELDQVAKFPMAMVMQWKKADEIYGELKKDTAAARVLQSEIEKALTGHPRARLDEEFLGRCEALTTRLSQISDPMTSRSFPRPSNPRYPDQKAMNDSLAEMLSTELRGAIKAARAAASTAKQYHAASETVKNVRKLNSEMVVITATFAKISERLTNGVVSSSESGDGSPPSLQTQECLHPLSHSAFIAFLPSVISELDNNAACADVALRDTRTALASLRVACLDGEFVQETNDHIAKVEESRKVAEDARQVIESTTSRLRTTRDISVALARSNEDLISIRERVIAAVERHKWKPDRARDGAPLTPESPSLPLPALEFYPEDARTFSQTLKETFASTIEMPWKTVQPFLGTALASHLDSKRQAISDQFTTLDGLFIIWEDIRRQSNVMHGVRSEAYEQIRRIEDAREGLLSLKDAILRSPLEDVSDDCLLGPIKEVDHLRAEVDRFTTSLSSRIPMISRNNHLQGGGIDIHRIDPSNLDQIVKTDANAYSMSLAGGVDSLTRHVEYVRLAVLARGMDESVETTLTALRTAEDGLVQLSRTWDQTSTAADLESFEIAVLQCKTEFDALTKFDPSRIRGLLTSARRRLSSMEASAGAQDPVIHEAVIMPRKRALSNAARRVESLGNRLQHMREELETRIEGAVLGRRLESAITTLRHDHAQSVLVVANLEKSTADVALDDVNADSILVNLDNRVTSESDSYRTRRSSLIAALNSTRLSLQESNSFRDVVIFKLTRSLVEDALRAENDVYDLHHAFLGLFDHIYARRDLAKHTKETISSISHLKASTDTRQKKIDQAEEDVHQLSPDIASEPQLLVIRSLIETLLMEHQGGFIDPISDLRGVLSNLIKHASCKVEKDVALLEHIRRGLDQVSNSTASQVARLTDILDVLRQKQDILKHTQAADDTIKSAELALLDIGARYFSTSTALNELISTFALVDPAESLLALSELRDDCERLQRDTHSTLSPLESQLKEHASSLQCILETLSTGVSGEPLSACKASIDRVLGNCSQSTVGVHHTLQTLTLAIEQQTKVAQELDAKRRMDEETKATRLREELEEQKRANAKVRGAEVDKRRQDAKDAVRRLAEETVGRQLAEREGRLAAERETRRVSEELARMKNADAARLQMKTVSVPVAGKEHDEPQPPTASNDDPADVFGIKEESTIHRRTTSQEDADMKIQIHALRSRLRALSLNHILRPNSQASSSRAPIVSELPTLGVVRGLQEDLDDITSVAANLPPRLSNPSVQAELKSLQFELEASKGMMVRIHQLGAFGSAVADCDNALSALLEYMDAFPTLPFVEQTNVAETYSTPEQRLSGQLDITGAAVERMRELFSGLPDDDRVSSESNRLEQTWSELWEMSMDKINHVPSRPASSVRTGSEHAVSPPPTPVTPLSNQTSHASLRRSRATSSISSAVGPSIRPGSVNDDRTNRARQAAMGHGLPSARSLSRISTRSVSGPLSGSVPATPTGRAFGLNGSTFASRQRTVSGNSLADSVLEGTPRRSTSSRPRLASAFVSPAPSDASRAARAGRSSIGGPSRTPRAASLALPPVRQRRQYVPNQNHRVDVAVAKIVNDLDPELNINIEPVSWKDQSGKYWIGDKDPKLCFCRILRSQTVMVRVGGGWLELSKFLRGHYDLFRVMPSSLSAGSPPREEEEQRWISSATLLSSAQLANELNSNPRTPEPRKSSRGSLSPLNPNFVTPVAAGRGSPIRHLRSSLSPVPVPSNSTSPLGGSPLTPLQFLRRADDHPQPHLAIPAVALRPSTPANIPPASKPGSSSAPLPIPLARTVSNPPAQPSKPRRWRP